MKKTTTLFILVSLFLNSLSYSQINLGTTIVQHTVVASYLTVPWDMAYGPDGWIWFTELGGSIKRMNPDTYQVQQVFAIFSGHGAVFLQTAARLDNRHHLLLDLALILYH